MATETTANPVARLATAQFISTVGDGFNSVAITVAVLDRGMSPTVLGVVLGARVLALALMLLVGGVVGDKIPRRQLLVGVDLVRGTSQAALAVLVLAHAGGAWTLAGLQFVHGAASGIAMPALQGLIPTVIAADRLQRANSVLWTVYSFGSLLGPILAAVVVGWAGPGAALLGDSASFFVSAMLFASLATPGAAPDAAKTHERLAESLRTGYQDIAGRRWLVAGILFFTGQQALLVGPLYVLGPVLAASTYGGAERWGHMLAMFGLGAVAGSLAAMRFRPARPLRWVFGTAALPAAGLAALGLGAPYAFVLGGMALAGLGVTYSDVIWSTFLQRHIPADRISRVMSWDLLSYVATRPISMTAAGPLAALTGPRPALLATAAALVGAATWAAIHPATRQITDHSDTARTVR